jgi:hypothetical protein
VLALRTRLVGMGLLRRALLFGFHA